MSRRRKARSGSARHSTARRRVDTRTTREVETSRNMHNRKPYRTPDMKRAARDVAEKVNGRFISAAPVLRHEKHERRDVV
jgi:hypothetical protein